MSRRDRVAALLLAVVLIACSSDGATPAPTPGAGSPSPSGPFVPDEIVLMTHDSFALSEDLLADFTARTGTRLTVLRSGDAGSMVNQAILSVEHPLANVLFGVDTTFLTRALEADLFEPYEPAALASVPPVYQVDDRVRVTPIDVGDVCLNIDREAFAAPGAPPPPGTLDDLVRAEYRDLLVVQDPATSSPGLAFLLATIVRFGDTGETTWRDYWAALRDNGVFVSDGWEDAYYTRFSGGSGEGDRPIVVSYASSPAAEVVFADPQPDEAPTAAILDGCFRQVEFAGVLANNDPGALAASRALIDFLLSREVQEDIPLNMFVYPVRSDAVLPQVFVEHAQLAPEPLTMPFARIGQDRQRWIEEWTDIVLR